MPVKKLQQPSPGVATPADLDLHDLTAATIDLQNQIDALKGYIGWLEAALHVDTNGNLIAMKNLTVRGDHTVKGDIHANGNLIAMKNLTVGGDHTVNGDIHADGDLFLD
jgi:hypothetical protein